MSVRFWMVVALIALAFFTGGGSRADIESLLILRPVAIIACGYALWTINAEHLRRYRVLLVIAAVAFALFLLQLLPLPPGLWHALPGRQLIIDVDRVAGIGDIWRPISMVPEATWNAFYSLFVPLAFLLLGIQLDREERFQLLPVFIGFGVLSGLMGAMQVIGAGGKLLYFYRITNEGLAVGLFANRNHAAIYLACLFPMLAVYASLPDEKAARLRLRTMLAVVVSLVLIPLIIVTGSRTGLLVGVAGLVAAPFLYRSPFEKAPVNKGMADGATNPDRVSRSRRRGARKFRLRLGRSSAVYAACATAVIALGSIAMFMTRGNALQRLFETREGEDRGITWSASADMAREYFPVGSGFGSFTEVFKAGEPQDALGFTYTNHVHNDWLEMLMTGGLPAILLLLVLVALWGWRSYRAWFVMRGSTREAQFSRLASVLFFMLALASIGDYPLRIPSLMGFVVFVALWLRGNPVAPSGEPAPIRK